MDDQRPYAPVVTVAETPEDRAAVETIRQQVLVEEYGQKLVDEVAVDAVAVDAVAVDAVAVDEGAATAATLFLLRTGGRPVAAGRYRRVARGSLWCDWPAVLKDSRDLGVDRVLLQFMLHHAHMHHPDHQLSTHAPVARQDFLESLGWDVSGESFDDGGARYVPMVSCPPTP